MKKFTNYLLIGILKYISYLPFVDVILLRSWCYKFVLKKVGKNFRVTDNVTIISPEYLEIGDNVSIHENSLLACQGGLIIGDYSALGSSLIISTSEHKNANLNKPIKSQGILEEKVSIGRNVWIGARVTILKGTIIGDDAIIGAGSLVNKNVLEKTVVAGVPAKVVRYRR
jgi:acetyltransferase-like isoleucine patch superfamily enzyme